MATGSSDLEHLIRARRAAKDGSGRELRHANGLSIADVAGEVEAAEATIWRWERGERRPTGAAAIRWGRLLQRLDAMKQAAS